MGEMKLPKPQLSALPGNRRGQTRVAPETTAFYTGHAFIGELGPLPCRLTPFGPGYAMLDLDETKLTSTELDRQLEIRVDSDESRIFNGSWLIKTYAGDGRANSYLLEHPEAESLSAFAGWLSPITAWLSSHLAVLRLHASTPELAIATHVAELKDTLTPPVIHLSHGQGLVTGNFNFSAELSTLRQLTFHPDILPDDSIIGQTVRLDYVFCAVRYLIQSKVLGVDPVFGDILLGVPDTIVAVTDRQHWRVQCRLAWQLILPSGNSLPFSLRVISATGASGTVDGLVDLDIGSTVTIQGATGGLVLAVLTALQAQEAVFTFLPPIEGETKDMLRLMAEVNAAANFQVRDSGNASAFLALYREIGYGRTDPVPGPTWEVKSQAIWQIQDSALPGNTVGSGDSHTLQVSYGVIPIAKRTIYGHSLAMSKSLPAIAATFDIMARSLWWTELLPQMRYYLGAARHSSRFSTRLFTSIQGHADSGSIIFPSLKVLWSAKPAAESKLELQVETCTLEVAAAVLAAAPKAFSTFFTALTEPSPWPEAVHHVVPFVLRDAKGTAIAAGVRHRSQAYFTAADIFNFDALFFATKLVPPWSQLHQLFGGSGYAIEVLLPGTLAASVVAEAKVTPKDWYFIHRQDLGPIVASFTRSMAQVMSKYGDEAVAYLQRTVL